MKCKKGCKNRNELIVNNPIIPDNQCLNLKILKYNF